MFHPVGPEPPSVYWRRRLVVIGSVLALLALVVLTVKVAASSGGGAASAGTTGSATRPSVPLSTSVAPKPPATTHRKSSTAAGKTAKSGTGATSTAAAPPAPCTASALAVAAVSGKSAYKVGDEPVLELQVTNTGAKPCVQDLADKQVELRVYNGESRVWGSHDCKVQPGVDKQTLTPAMPVRVAITWSGLTSQPRCAGTRQRVGAGTYTLYAALSGKTGKASQFTIS